MAARLRAFGVASFFAIGACSVWVSSEPDPIGCTAEGKLGPPACESGFICAHQQCARCGAREACADGVDNDCNGRIDDGCPTVSAGGGSAAHAPPTAGVAGVAEFAGGGGIE